MSTATSAVQSPASVSSAEAPPPRFDFPGWLPPMLVKELRQGLRQRGFVGGLIGAHALLVVMFIAGFVTEVDAGSSRSMINGVFWSTMFAVLLLFAPFRALGALHAEIDSRTMDLLLLTRLDSWRIVWGKWVSLVTQSLLLVVSLLPYAVVRYFFGSVEVVQDLVAIAMMLVTSAVFTAVGLWASGLNRVLRLLVIIGAVLMSFGALGNILSHSMMTGRMFWGSGFTGAASEWLLILTIVWGTGCVIAFALMLAVRWFAPLAENHAIGPRLLPLALLVPFPFWLWLESVEAAAGYAAVALFGWLCVAAIEMAGARELMPIHLRGALGRPGWRRVAGSLLLPGWESAARWLAVLLTLAFAGVAVAHSISPMPDTKLGTVAWLAVLVWTGLVAPAVIVSRLRSIARVSGLMYFILHGLFGALAAMAGSTTLGKKTPTFILALDWVSDVVPPMSFWQTIVVLDKSSSASPVLGIGQVVGVVLMVGLVWWLSRPYWARVREMSDAAHRPGTGE